MTGVSYREVQARGQAELDAQRKVAETRSHEHRAAAWRWAASHVTDLDRGMVASTALSLRHRLGRWPTDDQIRARLHQQGRAYPRQEAA